MTRHCWACSERLRPNQIKCIECDSWQNWRRYLVFSSTTLALVIAVLSSLTAILAVSDRFLPKGVLVAVADGHLLKNEVQVYNNERYPIIVFGKITCDISGDLTFLGEDVAHDLGSVKEEKIRVDATIASEFGVERIIKSGEFVAISVSYSGQGLGFEYAIQFSNVDSLLRGRLAVINDGGVRPVENEDNYNTIRFAPKQEKSCTITYRTAAGEVKTVPFENRFVERDIVSSATRVFF